MRKTRNNIFCIVFALFCFLPFQNCGEKLQSSTAASQNQNSCEPEECQTGSIDEQNSRHCVFNGNSVAEGASVVAYFTSVSGDCLQKENRTCENGVLSGSYLFASCSTLPESKKACLFNAMTILDGGVITAYQASRVAFGQTCAQESRKCSNGTFDGTYTEPTCSVDAPAVTSNCDSYPHDRKISVSTVAELRTLATRAIAGDLFVLSAGTYLLDSVVFENLKGTSAKMITFCGDGAAKIIGPGASSGKRILTLKNSQYVRVAQIEFSLGMKGLMVEGTSYSRFEKLTIHDVGHEALHLMLWSHHNVIENSRFYNTGKESGAEGIGEGVYIGTSLSKGIEDASDYNQILNNQFGPGITAEHIDIKEFTAHGLIEGNGFDGRGITQENSAESWVNIKGNYYLIKNNHGKNTPVRGFKQIVLTPGQGNFNIFENNSGELNNANPDRMLIYLHRESSDAPDNQVYCNNKVLDQGVQYMTNAKKCIQP